jgi:hypothetical protein
MDAVTKAIARQMQQEGVVTPDLRITPDNLTEVYLTELLPSFAGVDFDYPVKGEAWDLMTQTARQVLEHDIRYGRDVAPLLYPQLQNWPPSP